MSEALGVLSQLKKNMGDTVGSKGVLVTDVTRIPTGIFQFDLHTGGGIPTGKVSIIFGQESSGKTNLALLTIKNAQRMFPKQKAVFIDLEHSFDAQWAHKMGVDVDNLILMHPDFAEQAVDIIEALCYADDVSIIVIDSIGAMTTEFEVKEGASKVIVGGSSVIVSKLMSKVTVALSKEAKRGHRPAILCINQRRFKIGVMFGDPEKMPGGEKLRFTSALTIRVYGKDEIVKEVNPSLPSYKEISVIVKKNKVPILSKEFDFKMCVLDNAQCKVGESPSWKSVAEFLTSYEILGKGEKKGWVCFNEEFPTLTAIQAKYASDAAFKEKCQKEVIRREMESLNAKPLFISD